MKRSRFVRTRSELVCVARMAAHWISELRGWRRAAAAGLAGIGAALAMAPIYAIPLLFVSVPVLIWLLDSAAQGPAPLRSGFFTGWLFGVGYFLAGVYWLSLSLLVDAGRNAWLLPFALTLIPSFLGLFPAVASALYAKYGGKGATRLVAFASLFAVSEYVRGHIFTGFPWNLTGQVWAATPVAAQFASIVGVYGLGFITLLLASFISALASEGDDARALCIGLFAPIGGLVLLCAFGVLRLATTDIKFHENIELTIVQPNIAQRDKVDPDRADENLRRHIELSRLGDSGSSPVKRIVIWPENAAPVVLSYRQAHLAVLQDELAPGVTLVTGSVRLEADTDSRRFFNAMHVFGNSENGLFREATYDKHHLAPFGEYIPLAGMLSRLGLSALSSFAEGGLAAGPGPQTFDLGQGRPAFSPLICYEAVFPGALYPVGRRPEWLLNITNDAWFGDSSGPRQHLDQARLRAVETGLPLARAANTGVSALIDPLGRILARAPLYEAIALETGLPRAIRPTLYARFGDTAFAFLLASAAMFVVWRRRRRERPSARSP